MGPTDPNNTLGNANPTHINAFYADLAQAEQDLAIAQGRVNSAKNAIVAQGGTVPADGTDAEDITVAGDEAQLAQDETADTAADVNEVPESDAPVAPAETPEPETPAEETSETTEETAPQPGDTVAPTV